jgi:membrane protease YdiL (CAAX protease family)
VPTFNEAPALAVPSANSISPDAAPANLTNNPDPNNPVWGVAGALLIWVLSIVLQGLIPILFVIPFALHRGLNPGAPDFAKLALELAVTDRTAILLQVISILPTHLLVLGVLWAFVTRFGKRPFLASFGWNSKGGSAWLERALLIAVGVTLFLVATVLAKLLGGQKPTQLEQLINSSIAARYAIAALAVFTAPFVEEFIYRGVLYSALQRTIGVNAAVVFVLGLFTLIHVPQYWPNIGVIAAIALLSIVLTIVRAYSGRLLPCIIIHMAFNGVQALLLILEPYLQRLVPTTEPAVPTASMLLPLLHSLF